MSTPKMIVENRSGIGSNKVNKLRVEGLIPGVIYKRGEETKHIQVDDSEFRKIFRLAGTTSVIDLELDGGKHPVIIKDLQRHPFKSQFVHIDFLELNMDELIKVMIPINLVNRDNIQLQPSVLNQILDEVEVECLPGNIPSVAEVDVADMDYTTPIFVSDLDIAKDEKVTILAELDSLVCTLSEAVIIEDEEEEIDELEDAGDVPLVSEEEETEEE